MHKQASGKQCSYTNQMNLFLESAVMFKVKHALAVVDIAGAIYNNKC